MNKEYLTQKYLNKGSPLKTPSSCLRTFAIEDEEALNKKTENE